MFLNNFDIYSNFYSDPELKLLFKSEFTSKVSSNIMWALFLYLHPKSKFATLDDETKIALISSDYLGVTNWNPSDYKSTIDRIKLLILTPVERFLITWNTKLNEINSFLDSKKFDETTAEMLTKTMKDFYPMMKQYREILKDFTEATSVTHGSVQESASEAGLI